MRTIVWVVLLFVVAVVAALTLGDNTGMASFYWGGWRVDLSLNFFILAALATGFALMTAVQRYHEQMQAATAELVATLEASL